MNWSEVQQLLESMQKNIDCPICLEIMKNPVLTTCNHNFCNFCISKFLETKRYTPCPMCKVPLTKRSLRENCRLKNIIDKVKKLVSAIEADTGWTYTSSKNWNYPAHRRRQRVNGTGLKRKVSLEDTPELRNEIETKNTRIGKRKKSVYDSNKDEDSPFGSARSGLTTVQACSSSNKFSLEPHLSDTQEALPIPQNDKGKLINPEHSLCKNSINCYKPSSNLRSARVESTNTDRKLETLIELAKEIGESVDSLSADNLVPKTSAVIDGHTKVASQSATISGSHKVSEARNGTRHNCRRITRRSIDNVVPCQKVLGAAQRLPMQMLKTSVNLNRSFESARTRNQTALEYGINVEKTTASPIKTRRQMRCQEAAGDTNKNGSESLTDRETNKIIDICSKRKRILFPKSAAKSFRKAGISQETDSAVNMNSLNTNIENQPQMNISQITKIIPKQGLPARSVLGASEDNSCFVTGGQFTETNSDSSSSGTSQEIVTGANLTKNNEDNVSSCMSPKTEKDPFDVIVNVSQQKVEPSILNCEDNSATLKTVNESSFKWSVKPDSLKTYSRKLGSLSRKNRIKISRWLHLLPTNFNRIEDDPSIDANDGLRTSDDNVVGKGDDDDGLRELDAKQKENNLESGYAPDFSVSQLEDKSSQRESKERTKCGRPGSSVKSDDGNDSVDPSCEKESEFDNLDPPLLKQKNVSGNKEIDTFKINSEEKEEMKISEGNLENDNIDLTLNVVEEKDADISGNHDDGDLSRIINSRKKNRHQIPETNIKDSNTDFSLENISMYTSSPEEFHKRSTQSKDADPYKFIESPKLIKPHRSCKRKKSRRSSKMPELSFQNRLTRSFQKCSSFKNLKTDLLPPPEGEHGRHVAQGELHAKEPPLDDYGATEMLLINGKLCSASLMEYPPHDGHSGSANNARLDTSIDINLPAPTGNLETILINGNNVQLGSGSDMKHSATSRNSKDPSRGCNNAKLGSENEHPPTRKYSEGSSGGGGNHAKLDSYSEKEQPATSRHSEDCSTDVNNATFGPNTDNKPLARSRYYEESLKVGKSNRKVSDMQNSFKKQLISGDDSKSSGPESNKSRMLRSRNKLMEKGNGPKIIEPLDMGNNRRKSGQPRRSRRVSKINERISEEEEIMDLVKKISSAEEYDLLFNSQDVAQSLAVVSDGERGESKTHLNNHCGTDKTLSDDVVPSVAACDGEKDSSANDGRKTKQIRTDGSKIMVTDKTRDTNIISQNSCYGNQKKDTSLSEVNNKDNRNKNGNVCRTETVESLSASELTMEGGKKTCLTSRQNMGNEIKDTFVKPLARTGLRRNKLSACSFDFPSKNPLISRQISSSKIVMSDDKTKGSKDKFLKTVNGKDGLLKHNADSSEKEPQIPTSSSSTSSEINKLADTKTTMRLLPDRNLLNRKDEDSEEITNVHLSPRDESEVGITRDTVDSVQSVGCPQKLPFCSRIDTDRKSTDTMDHDINLKEHGSADPELENCPQIISIDDEMYTVIDSVPLDLYYKKVRNDLKSDSFLDESKSLEENANTMDATNRLNLQVSRSVFQTPKHTPVCNKVIITPTVIPETPLLVLMFPNPDIDTMKSSEQRNIDQMSVISREKNFDGEDDKDETENEKRMAPRITLPVKGFVNLGNSESLNLETNSYCSNNSNISRQNNFGEEEEEEVATKITPRVTLSVEMLKTSKSVLHCPRQYNDANLRTGDSKSGHLVVGSEHNSSSDVSSNHPNIRKSHSVRRTPTKYTSRPQDEDNKEISPQNHKTGARKSNLRFCKRTLSSFTDDLEPDVSTQIFESDTHSSQRWMDEDLLPSAKTITNQIQDLPLTDSITEKSSEKPDVGGNQNSLRVRQQQMSMKIVEECLSVPEKGKRTWSSVRHELVAPQPGNSHHLKDHYLKKDQKAPEAVNGGCDAELVPTEDDSEGHSSGTEDLNLSPDPSEFEPPNLAIQPESVMQLLSIIGATKSIETDSTHSDSSPTKLDRTNETPNVSPILQDKNSRNTSSSDKESEKSTQSKTSLVPSPGPSRIKNCLRKKTPNKIYELSSPSDILSRTQNDQISSQGSFGHSSLRQYMESQDERLCASLTSPCQILCYSSEGSTKESPKTMMELSSGSPATELPISKSSNNKVKILPNVRLVDYDVSQSSILSDTDSDSVASFALPVARRTRSRSQIQNCVQKNHKIPEVKLKNSSQETKLVNSPINYKQNPKILEESTKVETFPTNAEKEKNEILPHPDSWLTTTANLDTMPILKSVFTQSKTNDCTLEELVLPKSGTVEKEVNNLAITESDNFLSSAERNFLISGFCESEEILDKDDIRCENATRNGKELVERTSVLETGASTKIIKKFADHLSEIREPSEFGKVDKSAFHDLNSPTQAPAPDSEDLSENTLEPTQLSSQRQSKSKSLSGFVLKSEDSGTTLKRQQDLVSKVKTDSSMINVLDTETVNIVDKKQSDPPSEINNDSSKINIPDTETVDIPFVMSLTDLVIPDSLEPFVYDKKESQNSHPPKLSASNENISQSSRSSVVPCSVEQDGSLANVLEAFHVVYKEMAPSEIVCDVTGFQSKNDLVRTTNKISKNINNNSLRSTSLNIQNFDAQIPRVRAEGTAVLKPNDVQDRPHSAVDIIEEPRLVTKPASAATSMNRNPSKIAFSTECHLMIDSQNFIPVKRSKRKCFSLASNSLEPPPKPRDGNISVVISDVTSNNQISSKNLDSNLVPSSPNNINQQVQRNHTSLSDKLENAERRSAEIPPDSSLQENILKDNNTVESCVLLPVSQIEEFAQVPTKDKTSGKTSSKEPNRNVKSGKNIGLSSSGIEELPDTAQSVSSLSSPMDYSSKRGLSQRHKKITKKENQSKSLKNSNIESVCLKSPNSQIESYLKILEPSTVAPELSHASPTDSCTQQPSCPFSIDEEEGMVVSDPTDNDTLSTQAPSLGFSEECKITDSILGEDSQPICQLEQDQQNLEEIPKINGDKFEAEESVEMENRKAKNMENVLENQLQEDSEDTALSSASTKCPSGFSDNSSNVPSLQRMSSKPDNTESNNKSKNLSGQSEKNKREEVSSSEARLKTSPRKVGNPDKSNGNDFELNPTEIKEKSVGHGMSPDPPPKGQSQKDDYSMDDINFSLPDIPASQSEGVYSETRPDEDLYKTSVLQKPSTGVSNIAKTSADKQIPEAKSLESNPANEDNKTVDQEKAPTDSQISSLDTKPTAAADSLAVNKDLIMVSHELPKGQALASKFPISDCNSMTSSSKHKTSRGQTMSSADNTDVGNFSGRCDKNVRLQSDSDELEDSEEFLRQRIKKPRCQVINDASDEDEEKVETINLEGVSTSSPSALSTQTEKFSTQQCTYLEQDLEEMKKQIAQLEAQLGLDDNVIDVVTEEEENEEVLNSDKEEPELSALDGQNLPPGTDCKINQVDIKKEVCDQTYTRIISSDDDDDDDNDGDVSRQVIPDSDPDDKNIEQNKSTVFHVQNIADVDAHSSGEESADLFCTPGSPPASLPQSVDREHKEEREERLPKKSPIEKDQSRMCTSKRKQSHQKRISKSAKLPSDLSSSSSEEDAHIVIEESPKRKIGTKENDGSRTSRIPGKMKERLRNLKERKSKSSPRLEKNHSQATSKANLIRENKSNSLILKELSSINTADTPVTETDHRKKDPQPKCFIATGLSNVEVNHVKMLVSVTGGNFLLHFSKDVTHVIVKTVSENGRYCDRTLKYFQGIANKCWILSYRWIKESLEKKRLLQMDEYEIIGDTVNGFAHRGPTRSRLSHVPLFKHFEIHIIGNSAELPQNVLKSLIEMSGGLVVSDPEELSSRPGITCLAVANSTQTLKEFRRLKNQIQIYGILLVSREWILDSVAMFRLQSLEGYIQLS